MNSTILKSVIVLIITIYWSNLVSATALPIGYEDPEHGEAHTYIGRNWDGTTGTNDDNKLWIGAAQILEEGTNSAWPSWPTIELLPQFDEFGNAILNEQGQQFYKADEPDGWFSAHPVDGIWQLGGTDESIIPGWDISIKRLSATDGFFMLRLNDGQMILANDDDTEEMHKEWEKWLENGSGSYGSWGCHHHISFCAWADGLGQDIFATFVAIDNGTTQFTVSDPFTIYFTTVPEPASLIVFASGLAFIRSRSKRVAI